MDIVIVTQSIIISTYSFSKTVLCWYENVSHTHTHTHILYIYFTLSKTVLIYYGGFCNGYITEQ
jgi:hypothetical protein